MEDACPFHFSLNGLSPLFLLALPLAPPRWELCVSAFFASTATSSASRHRQRAGQRQRPQIQRACLPRHAQRRQAAPEEPGQAEPDEEAADAPSLQASLFDVVDRLVAGSVDGRDAVPFDITKGCGMLESSMELRISDYIAVDLEICGGQPCFKGTRIMVQLILEMLAAGDMVDALLEDYPALSRAHIQAALMYAAKTVEMGKLAALVK